MALVRGQRARTSEAVSTAKPGPKSPHRAMWAPGKSGNPLGRPKGVIEVRKLAQKFTVDAIEALVEIMKNTEEKGAARVAAANAVLDRAWGRPMNVEQVERTIGTAEANKYVDSVQETFAQWEARRKAELNACLEPTAGTTSGSDGGDLV